MYVILQLQHSVGDVSNSTSSTVQSLTELVLFFCSDNQDTSILVSTINLCTEVTVYRSYQKSIGTPEPQRITTFK